ncbi:MAG: DoxX family protein [Bacteroidales bacterium]|nr:DoxX family protein [Bacteroidales bacterium]
MRVVSIISKLIIGLVFTFSGFVKCVDPLGTAYKINDYLVEFGLNSLTEHSLLLSVLMCGIELLIGLMLLSNTSIKISAWLSLIFLIVYTPLTLYLAIFNPVTDCGCFGDALIITNWQTFFKNVILIILAIILVFRLSDFTELFSPKYRYLFLLFLAIIVFGFELFSLNRLPIMDFRPYKVGENIQEGMEIPEGAPQDIREFIFTYEKDGKTDEFTIDNLPSDDGWTFVSREEEVISVGYEPPIHNFNITTMDGFDITDEILSSGYVCLLIAYNLSESVSKHQDDINTLANIMLQSGYRFICLTSSGQNEISSFEYEHQTPYEFCTADPTTLKTIVRSNPGLLIMKNGTIMNKWHHKHLPSPGELSSEIQTVEY